MTASGLAQLTGDALSSDDDQEVRDLAAHRRLIRGARAKHLLLKVAGVAILLAVWEVAALVAHDQLILPSVQTTATTFVHYLGTRYPANSDPLWEDLAVSLRRIFIGFAVASAAGMVVGAAMWSSRPLRSMIDPIIELTRPLPTLAFIPLLVVWFGIGELTKVVLVIIGALPVMVIATVAALDNVPPEMEQRARTLGASRLYTLFHVQLRAAAPGIITGMRVCMGGAWTAIVGVEMVAANTGIGYFILQAGNYLLTALVMSGIIAIGTVNLAIDAALRGLLRLADPSRAVAK